MMVSTMAPIECLTCLVSVRATLLAVTSRASSAASAARRPALSVSVSSSGSAAASLMNVTQVGGSWLSMTPVTSTVSRVPSLRRYSLRCGP